MSAKRRTLGILSKSLVCIYAQDIDQGVENTSFLNKYLRRYRDATKREQIQFHNEEYLREY